MLQRIAYELMLQTERRATHLGVVAVLRKADQAEKTPPEVIAYHLTEAGEFREAIEAWLRAGAMRPNDPRMSKPSNTFEAGSRCSTGSGIANCAPATRAQSSGLRSWDRSFATEGATSVRVSECCQRGLELCRQGEPTPLVLPFAFGQFTFTNCHGQVQEAVSLARLFLSGRKREQRIRAG